MNGLHVGRWHVTSKGEHELHYDDDWVHARLGRPISLSMPLRPAAAPYKGELVRNFFENLLPDNRTIRQRIAKQFGTGVEAFNLLAEIGRDCVGALQLLPEGHAPTNDKDIQAVALTEPDVAKHLSLAITSSNFGADEEGTFRISLAGAQEKTALTWHKDSWARPVGSTPTTHIFKLPLGQFPGGIDLTTSVENEWLCLKLLQAFDVPAASARILTFEDRKVLCVERFDRRLTEDGRLLRLPQEDFAQVFGIDPNLKYESDGGPGIREILDILTGSANALVDRQDFFRTQVLFWMLGAIDGHAKNFSLFLEPQGFYRLTPRYDVLSAYPVMGNSSGMLSPKKARMAMAVWGRNRHYKWADIRRQHFELTAAQCHVPHARTLIDELIERTPQAIVQAQEQLPKDFPPAVADAIFSGLRSAGESLRTAENSIAESNI